MARRFVFFGGATSAPAPQPEAPRDPMKNPLEFPDMDQWEKGLAFEGLRNKEKEGPEIIAAVRANLGAMRTRISAGEKPPHVESIPPTKDEEEALVEADRLLAETRSRLGLPTTI